MDYTKAAGEKSTVKLTITFTEEEWQAAVTKAYFKTRGKFSVPGFRKGKAPKPVIENYYGKSAFYEEALNGLFSENYAGILEKERENFTAVGEPDVNVESLEEGKGAVISASVPVKPDIEIEKYTGLKIKKFEYNVTDEDVEKEVKRLQSAHAVPVEVKDKPCIAGDIVNIDFTGVADGKKFEGGSAENYDLELGSGNFIPGFEEGVEGMKTGETKDINVTFPADYGAEDLKGKQAVFTVKLNKITEKQYPELNDEFVKKYAGCETVDEYRAKCRERLERSAANRGRDETEGSILTEIASHVKAEIPEAMIERETDNIVQEIAYRFMGQGLKIEDYLKYLGTDMKTFRSQYTAEARRRVISQLIVDKIVRTENIKAEESEVDARIEEQAKSVDKTVEEYKKSLDPRQIDYISNDIAVTKLFEFLQENNEMYTDGDEKEETPAEKPAAAKPKTAKPAAAKPKTDKPAAAKPKTEKPAAKSSSGSGAAKQTKKKD